jgi:hypothetical protein
MVSTYQPKNGDWGMVYCVFLPHQIAVFARRSRIVLGSQNVSRLRDLKKASSRGCITSQQVWEVFFMEHHGTHDGSGWCWYINANMNGVY